MQPKPPPTSGAITRMRSSGMPRQIATCCFAPCGVCVELQSVSFCGPSSQCATTARPSIESGATRWFTRRSDTVPSASRKSCSSFGFGSAGACQQTFEGSSS